MASPCATLRNVSRELHTWSFSGVFVKHECFYNEEENVDGDVRKFQLGDDFAEIYFLSERAAFVATVSLMNWKKSFGCEDWSNSDPRPLKVKRVLKATSILILVTPNSWARGPNPCIVNRPSWAHKRFNVQARGFFYLWNSYGRTSPNQHSGYVPERGNRNLAPLPQQGFVRINVRAVRVDKEQKPEITSHCVLYITGQ